MHIVVAYSVEPHLLGRRRTVRVRPGREAQDVVQALCMTHAVPPRALVVDGVAGAWEWRRF